MFESPPVNIELRLSETGQCDHCRAVTIPVAVDAGGPSLPLFVVGKPIRPSGEHVVQIVRGVLQGSLCLNCGRLSAQTRLSSSELEAYRGQISRLSGPRDSAESPLSLAQTRVQRPDSNT